MQLTKGYSILTGLSKGRIHMKKLILSLLLMSTAVLAAKNIQKIETSSIVKPSQKKHDVVVYTSDLCGWCNSAKEILQEQKIPFREINVRGNKELIDKMERETGNRTVPQIMIDGKHFGSYLSLASANMMGDLDYLSENPKK